ALLHTTRAKCATRLPRSSRIVWAPVGSILHRVIEAPRGVMSRMMQSDDPLPSTSTRMPLKNTSFLSGLRCSDRFALAAARAGLGILCRVQQSLGDKQQPEKPLIAVRA